MWALVVAAAVAGCDQGGSDGRREHTTMLAAGEQLTCVLAAETRCWGGNPFLSRGPSDRPAEPFTIGLGIKSVASGRHHACLAAETGVACWGSNLLGQLAAAEVAERRLDRPAASRPLPVGGLPPVMAVVAGGFHTCALAADGAVWCWGANEWGQLGRPASPAPGPPARVPGVAAARALAAGLLHTCAVDGDGAVWCWGNDGNGRLGVEAAAGATPQPVAVTGLPGPATAVAAGVAHTCALLADGSVACWGGNRWGELGDGSTTSRSRPAPVRGLAGPASALAAGDHLTCAVLAAGAVACWGWNDCGQLGQGSFDGPAELDGFSASLEAVEVRGLPGPASAIAAGAGHACALVGGETWCWGRNEVGQLGDGSLDDRAAPVRAGISAGAEATTAPPRVARAGPMTGLDVSYHSGRVDWGALADQGHGFAFTLSTAGVDFHDPLFFSHWDRMRPLHRGAYHFFVAHDEPEAQARWFIANTPLGPGDLAPVVDIETLGTDPPRDLSDRLRRFVAAVERHYGVKPIVYTGPNFWDRNLGPGFGEHPLWIAEYDVGRPRVPVGWGRWTLWQHRGDATIPGAERPVDLNRIAAGVELEALLIPPRREEHLPGPRP